MTRTDHSFTRADLDLLHRALAYRRKRIHELAGVVRMQGLLDRVEELILREDVSPVLRLSPPEQEMLRREIPLYCRELTGRGASEAGAGEARRLQELVALLAGAKFPRTARPRWWRRLLGRRA
jgi:hypothetical protein